jgi:hypothetical protein
MAFVTFKYMGDKTTISYDNIDNINLVITHPKMIDFLTTFDWYNYRIVNICIKKHVIINSEIKFIIFNINYIDRKLFKAFSEGIVLKN